MNELPAALLQALSAAAVAVVVTVAVVAFSRRAGFPRGQPHTPGLSAVGRLGAETPKNDGASADDAKSRLRFPARALERLLIVGIVVIAAAVLVVFNVDGGADRDVVVGAVAVAVGLGWMLWRGTFLSLQVGSRRG